MSPTRSNEDSSDGEDLPANPYTSEQRFADLVARKRAEREAREAATETQDHHSSDTVLDPLDAEASADSEVIDPEVERIMSDAAKPTRKASKRAMLDIERETQRLARQQALAHQMKVKKKFSTLDLLAKFKYDTNGEPRNSEGLAEEDQSASSAPNSDASEPATASDPPETPPSSPPTPLDRQKALVEQGALSKLVPVRQDSLASIAHENDDEKLPDVAELVRSSQAGRNDTVANPVITSPSRDVRHQHHQRFEVTAAAEDSDEELDIIFSRPSRFRVFDNARGNSGKGTHEPKAIHTLKHLAHLGADSMQTSRRKGRSSRPSVNPQVLETQLLMRAREHARQQQLERIAEMKAKGIEIMSAEDREKEAEEFQNLLEKARTEALKIRQAEKAAVSKDGADGEAQAVASDDESEDGDYENQSMADESGNDSEEEEVDANDHLDDVAEESDNSNESEDEEADHDENEVEDTAMVATQSREISPTPINGADVDDASTGPTATPRPAPRPRKSRIIHDDEENDGVIDVIGLAAPTAEPNAEVEADDPFAAFGFGPQDDGTSLLSPTQAFKATMQTPTQLTQQDSMDEFHRFAPPSTSSLPLVPYNIGSQVGDNTQASFVAESQEINEPINLAWETQAPETPVPGLKRGSSALGIETPGWEPTQDDGLPNAWQAAGALRREGTMDSIAEIMTQSTVRIRISESPAPVMPKRSRLVRGQRPVAESSDEEDEATNAPAHVESKNAFREMARKRKEVLTEAERAEATREAKAMMDEQAEESEDEYAGLGGDDYIAPETAQDYDIIDSSHIEVDEHALAAHHAERQRIEDEANANQLYKDLTTGALRRKQANMFDLDEDEDDLAMRRRQVRQREEARRRRLLLQDENIAGLAEGKQSKGKDAFLKAIADDDGGDDDMGDFSDAEDAVMVESTPTENPSAEEITELRGALREISGNKRRMTDDADANLPANKRRIVASAFRAPTSLLEVKRSVSFLLDEPNAIATATIDEELEAELASDIELSDEDKSQEDDNVDDDKEVELEMARQNDGGYAPDRAIMPPPRLPASQRRVPAVIDRLSLKRSSSSNSSDASSGPTAWAAPGGVGHGVPSLLRRATINTASSTNDRGVTTSNGISKEGSGVKMGGSKKSSLAYQARSEERKAIVEASIKKRAENTARIAQLRRSASAPLGRGLAGKFE